MTSETWEPRNEERDRMIRIAGVAYVVIEPWPDDPNGLEKATKLRDAIIEMKKFWNEHHGKIGEAATLERPAS